MTQTEKELIEIQKSLNEIKNLVNVPDIRDQPLLILTTIGFLLLVIVIKFIVNRSFNNKQSNQLELAKRDLRFSNFSTFPFLFLTCLTAVQLIKQFTVPTITNFATIAALYLVLEENSSKSRRILKNLEKKKDVTENSLEDRIGELEKQITNLEKNDLKKDIDLLKEENIELKKDIDLLKKEKNKNSRFSFFTINK